MYLIQQILRFGLVLGVAVGWSVGSAWYWPAAFVYGVVLVFVFAPLHETIHRTAFRTPWINEARGRDHYPNAWSMAMAGAGIRGGVVHGATDSRGYEVSEGKVDNRNLFATIFRALGIDPHEEYNLPGLPTFHRVEDGAEPIREILV